MDVKYTTTFDTAQDARVVFRMLLALRRLKFCSAVAFNFEKSRRVIDHRTVNVWT